MGWGDELMAAGQAARVSREAGGARVCIVDGQGAPRFSPLWDGLPFITTNRGPGIVNVVNGPGARPYIQNPFTREGGQRFTDWRARDNRPVVAQALVGARDNTGFILIEPTIKALANPNKRWPRWQEVVDDLPGVRWVQCGQAQEGRLRGVNYRRTETFLDAMRVLNRAALYVGSEGGMHHAAAALGVPAVVIFGGSPSVLATGYPDHRNFGGDDPCGQWEPCAHCAQVMNAITPDQVVQAVKDLLT